MNLRLVCLFSLPSRCFFLSLSLSPYLSLSLSLYHLAISVRSFSSLSNNVISIYQSIPFLLFIYVCPISVFIPFSYPSISVALTLLVHRFPIFLLCPLSLLSLLSLSTYLCPMSLFYAFPLSVSLSLFLSRPSHSCLPPYQLRSSL